VRFTRLARISVAIGLCDTHSKGRKRPPPPPLPCYRGALTWAQSEVGKVPSGHTHTHTVTHTHTLSTHQPTRPVSVYRTQYSKQADIHFA